MDFFQNGTITTLHKLCRRPIEEMEAELDRIEEEEASWHDDPETAEDPVDVKLKRIKALREDMDFDAARRLLYEVLVEGDDSQVTVAKNILAQLDDD